MGKKIGAVALTVIIVAALFAACTLEDDLMKTLQDDAKAAAVPVITIETQPAPETLLGAGDISGTLSVSASATGGATLSYQWYRNNKPDFSGDNTTLGNGTSASYPLPTDLTAGKYYYYCDVSAPGGVPVRSNVAAVFVYNTNVPGEYKIEPETKPLSYTASGTEPDSISVVLDDGDWTDTWTLSADKTWLRFSLNPDGSDAGAGKSGSGPSTPVYLVVDANSSEDVRTATVSLDGAAACTVTQGATPGLGPGVYVIDPTAKTIPSSGGVISQALSVKHQSGAYSEWTLSTDADWLTFSSYSHGSGDGPTLKGSGALTEVYPVAKANATFYDRKAKIFITVGGAGPAEACVITQEPAFFYTVRFYDGASEITDLTERYGPGTQITLPDRTKGGSTLLGWQLNGAGQSYNAEAKYTVTANTAFYAKWKAGTWTRIKNAAELDNVRTGLSGSYVLVNDISLSGYSSGAGWQPIGTETSPFTGKFDGDGYKITNLAINRPTEDYIGLFGYISGGGSVANLGLNVVAIIGKSRVGSIAGRLDGGSINDCYSTGNVESIAANAGGIAGVIIAASTVSNCYSTGNITTDTNGGGIGGHIQESTVTNCYSSGNINTSINAGGIGGYSYNSGITNCYSLGTITAHINNAGGILGQTDENTTITGCNSEGTISAAGANAGGISGWVNGSEITNCHSSGAVTAAYNVGGIVGWSVANSEITDCYSTGDVTAGNSNAGGIAGYADDSIITGCHSEGNVKAEVGTAGGIAAYAKDSEITDCHSEGAVTAGDNHAGGIVGYVTSGSSITGCHSEGAVKAEINSAGGIAGYAEASTITGCHSTGDVTAGNSYAGGIAGYVNGSEITGCHSIGAVTASNHAGGITGFAIESSEITDCHSAGNISSGGVSAAGIAGNLENGSSISGCSSTGTITATTQYAGGIAGYVNNGSSISDCYSTGNVTATVSNSGGIAGYMEEGTTITGCNSTGAVTAGNSYAGGIAGYVNNGSTITGCNSTGNVTVTINYAGGIAGNLYASTITNCHSTGEIKGINNTGGILGNIRNHGVVSNSWSTSTVTGTGQRIGGIIGAAEQGSGATTGKNSVSGCYYSGSVSGTNYVAGIVGCGDIIDITNCYSMGTVTGTQIDSFDIGGIAGCANNGSIITYCYSTSAVSGYDTVGGLAGYTNLYNSGGSVSNCFALNPSVKGTGPLVSRVATSAPGTPLTNNYAWSGMLNNSNNTTWDNKGAGNPNGADITTATAKTQAAYTGNGWTFDSSAWKWDSAYPLPLLAWQTTPSYATDFPAHLK